MPDRTDDNSGIDIRSAVEERLRSEEQALAELDQPGKSRLTSAKIKQCLQANELGDGTLFAHLMPDTSPPSPEQIAELQTQMEELRRLEAEALAAVSDQTPDADPITPNIVRACLAQNERGDGWLFSRLMRGKFIFNNRTDQWLEWTGHHWDDDRMKNAMAAVETTALRYHQVEESLSPAITEAREKAVEAAKKVGRCTKALKSKDGDQDAEAAAVSRQNLSEAEADERALTFQLKALLAEKGKLQRRVDRLRSIRGANNCLNWATVVDKPLAVVGDEFDKQPMLLPCANGVIDLETGKLLPGRPEDYLMLASPIEWHGIDAPCPEWEQFFPSILPRVKGTDQPDLDISACLGRLLGYNITGLITEQVLGAFLGEGRNGKGVLFGTAMAILGPLAWAISPELLLEQKNTKSSAGPSPDLVSLRGRRMVVAAETDENRRISGARIKQLTGGDIIVARSPYDRFEINISPTWKMNLHTNNIPKGIAKEFSLVQRLLLFKFPYMFVDDPAAEARKKPEMAEYFRPKDKTLGARLQKEYPGILAWFVRNCILWQKHGISPPASIKQNVEIQRLNDDIIGRFIEDACEIVRPEQFCSFKEVYEAFCRWYSEDTGDDDKYRPSKKKVSDDLSKRGFHSPSPRETGGTKYIHGIKPLVRVETAW